MTHNAHVMCALARAALSILSMMTPALLALLFALIQAAHTRDADHIDAPVAPAPAAPVVVELFTSQGCPMCPAANELLGELGEEADVLAIAYGVDVWDGYGWRDSFARPEFAERQRAYVAAGEVSRVYTPHFVVNGGPQKLRFKPPVIRAFVDDAGALSAEAGFVRAVDGLTLMLDGPVLETPAQIWLVTYQPGVETVAVEGGSNAGREVAHFNMARGLVRLQDWSGGPTRIALEPPEDGLALAALVNTGPGGRILAAANWIEP